MKSVFRAALVAVLAAAWSLPAFAAEPLVFRGPVVGPDGRTVTGNVMVSADDPLPVTGGGGGGGATSLTPFRQTGSTTISASSSSSRVALPSTDDTVLVTNTGLVAASIKTGNSSVTAATTDLILNPGMSIALDADDDTHLAAITSTSSATLTIVTGTGFPFPSANANINGPASVVGNIAAGSSDTDAPLKVGGKAKSSNPSAVTDSQRAEALFDLLGRQVITTAIRAQKGVQKTQISSSASETTIVTAAGSGVFADVYGIIATNTSGSDGSCAIKDATTGTTRLNLAVKAGTAGGFTVGLADAIPQATANNNWTATCTSLAAWEITVLYVKTAS